MLTEEIERTVNAIIYDSLKERIQQEDVTKEKSLIADLHADSIELIGIFYSIAASFGIELDQNEAVPLINIEDIYHYVKKRVNREQAV